MVLMRSAQVILFDMGNVLLTFNPQHIFKSLCADLSSKKHLISLFENQTWLALDQGLISQQEALDQFKKEHSIDDHPCLEKLFKNWHLHMLPIEGMDALVKALKQKGYRLVLASNASDRYHDYINAYPVFKHLDQLYFSCDLKTIKPSKQFFIDILQKEKVEPSSCFFIDDKLENCEMAKSLGMKMHHFNAGVDALVESLIKEKIL